MKITKKAIYGVMACSYMAKRSNTLVSSEEVATACGTTIGFMNLIFTDLRKSELVYSKKGPQGGYRLNKPFKDISVLQIFQATDEALISKAEPDTFLMESMSPESKDIIHSVFNKLLTDVNNVLSKLKVSEIIK